MNTIKDSSGICVISDVIFVSFVISSDFTTGLTGFISTEITGKVSP